MASSSAARSSSSRSRQRGVQASYWVCSACTATRTFSKALSCGNTLVIWNDLAMPRWAKRCCGSPVISRSSNHTRPLLGGNAPERMLKKVLLPAPFGPMIEVRSPGVKSVVTSDSARKPPNCLLTPSTRRIGRALMVRAAPRSPSEPMHERAPDAAREEQDQEDEQGPDEQLPVHGDQGDHVLQHQIDEGAEERAEEGAHA